LSTVCQRHDWPDGSTLRAFRGGPTRITSRGELCSPKYEKQKAREVLELFCRKEK
jgi:hypothetical protein